MDINGPESGAAILTHSLFAWNCVQNDPHSLGRLGCRRDSFLAHSMPVGFRKNMEDPQVSILKWFSDLDNVGVLPVLGDLH